MLAFPTFFGSPYIQFMPIFAQDILHRGAGGYGVLMAATGVGALCGALSVGRVSRTKRTGRTLLILTTIFAAALVFFSLSHWFASSIVILLLVGATETLFMATGNTLLQLNVPEQMRGRVMSVYSLIPMGLMPLGSMILGTIGEAVGTPLTVGCAAVLVLVFGLLSFRLFEAVRQMT